MNNVVQKSLQGWAGNQVQGWAVRIGVLAVGAACYVAVLSPSTASAGSSSVSQLKYLQTLAQLTGDSGQFSASSKAADYVQWARNRGLEPVGGWKPVSRLNSDVLAQSLVQLLGLNARRYEGDYYRTLLRQGINVEKVSSVSAESLAALIDDPVVTQQIFSVAASSTSPKESPGNGNGFGFGLGNNPNGIPTLPPPAQAPPNPANPQRTGNPHVTR